MNKAKLALGTIAVIAIVGGAVAARSAIRIGHQYFISTDGNINDCTIAASYTDVGVPENVLGTFVSGRCSVVLIVPENQ
jgi:hypothetical protein